MPISGPGRLEYLFDQTATHLQTHPAMKTNSQVVHHDEASTYLTSRGTRALAASIIFTSLAVIAVLARVYTRVKLIKRFGANDWMIIIALVCPNENS